DGLQMRDFVSVQDVVQANLLAMQQSAADGMALNIGSGEPISIHEVALSLAEALDVPIAAELTGKYRAGDIRHCYAEISRAKDLLGYEPKFRFNEGVKDLVAWLGSQQPADRAADAVAELNYYGLTA
ncbi:MAG TPA: GDP-mannose 4,6-dehydratase, partial [Candidatus Angelobacter sp.]|nr:GDP-mannose 4,6-dehydratase [Candidatus Angelobacter sp.]